MTPKDALNAVSPPPRLAIPRRACVLWERRRAGVGDEACVGDRRVDLFGGS